MRYRGIKWEKEKTTKSVRAWYIRYFVCAAHPTRSCLQVFFYFVARNRFVLHPRKFSLYWLCSITILLASLNMTQWMPSSFGLVLKWIRAHIPFHCTSRSVECRSFIYKFVGTMWQRTEICASDGSHGVTSAVFLFKNCFENGFSAQMHWLCIRRAHKHIFISCL